MKKYAITEYVHRTIENHVALGSICVDATAGNGNDTLFLCNKVGETGFVLAMDIQEIAILNTRKKLEEHGLENRVKLVCDSHIHMDQYMKRSSVDCIVFNLGYLPGGDHNLATKAESSIEAMEKSLKLLKKDGLLSVTIYSGGDSGFEERDRVLEWMKNLDSKKYLVRATQYINRENNPPVPVEIIKLKE